MRKNRTLYSVLTGPVLQRSTFVLFVLFSSFGVFAAPTVKLLSPYVTPDQGWTVRGSISFSVKASDSQGIRQVEFYVDNKLVNTDQAYPYSWLWATATYTTGSHALKAVAFNAVGQTTTIQQTVTVAAPLSSRTADGSVVTSGLLPAIQPVINNIRLRDVSVCRGGDGAYYLTGTGSDNNAWYHNEGINLWKSTDLNTWTYIGLIWSFEGDGTTTEQAWGSLHDKPYRAVWAPEFMYLKGNYYFIWSYPGRGSKLMRSTTGRPEGPYVNNRADGGTLFGNIDGSLFEDTNGTVYLAYESGAIVKLKSDLSGFDGKVNYMGTGDEGAFVFKHNGKYYLSSAKFMDNGRYSSYVGISTSPTGPFSQWHEALPSGGHNSYFQDSQGNWWGTFFGNDNQAPWREKPSVVKMAFNSDGTMKPAADQSRPGSSTGSLVSGATYSIAAKHSGQLLDVAANSTADGANVQQWPTGTTVSTNKQWVVRDVGSGYYTLTAVHSGKNLDVNARSTADGANVQQWAGSSTPATNQQFQILDAGNGYYQIKARHSGKCVDVDNASLANGANVQQWTCSGTDNQLFRFTRLSGARLGQPERVPLLLAYPNPSGHAFRVNVAGEFHYQITDQWGNLQEQGQAKQEANLGEQLKPGIYFLQVQTPTGRQIGKLIKK